MTTQCEMLIAHFKTPGATINPRQALIMFGINRLAPRILELKRKGMAIDSVMIEVEGRNGPAHVAQYKLAVPRAAGES